MRKPIKPKVHGIIDYTTSSAVAMAPRLLDMPRRAAALCYGLAGGYTALSMLTKYPAGAKKVVPFKGARRHRGGDRRRAAAHAAPHAFQQAEEGAQLLLRPGRHDRGRRAHDGLERDDCYRPRAPALARPQARRAGAHGRLTCIRFERHEPSSGSWRLPFRRSED